MRSLLTIVIVIAIGSFVLVFPGESTLQMGAYTVNVPTGLLLILGVLAGVIIGRLILASWYGFLMDKPSERRIRQKNDISSNG